MEHRSQPEGAADASARTEARARSQRRSTADDVIESGEIVERRSLVIRSQRPKDDEPTEIAPPLNLAPKRSWRALWLAVGLVAGVLAVLGLDPKPAAGATDALAGRAEMIATTLDAEARAAQTRAEALASSPVLGAAVTTDASTIADMVRDHDLTFQLKPGEQLEVLQVRDSSRSVLLRLPADAAPLEAPAAGQPRIDSAMQSLIAVATATVTRDGATAGEIVLSTKIDITPVIDRLADHASGASLHGVGDPIVLIASNGTPNVSIPIPVKTPVAGQLALAAVVPQARAPWAYACIGLSVLSLGMFVFSTVRASRAAR